jgi:heat shock protein HslJ
MNKLAPLAIAGTALLALSACGSADSDGATDASDDGGSAAVTLDDLAGTSYQATTGDALSSADQSLVEGSTVVVGFEGAGLTASAGCNGLFGDASIADGVLEVEGMGGTEMACADDLMAQERWLTEFLSSSPEIALDGGTLTLTGGDTTLTLSEVEGAEAPADPDAPDDGVTSMN